MDAFAGARAQAAAVRSRNYGIAVIFPEIPLYVPAKARQQLSDMVLDTIRLALQQAAGYLSGNAPVGATGSLAQSFGADPATDTGGLELTGVDLDAGISGRVFSSLPHAVVMDQGRRPGAPISMEGIDAIGYWAQRKLGLSADEADRAKWAIANVIVAQGIEGTHYVDKSMDEWQPAAERLLNDLAADIGDALTRVPRG